MMTPSTYRRRMQGLTLIETMVAITISLILMAGAITLFINNKVTYEVNDNLSRLQENARFAIEFMLDDLRMVGFFGCSTANEIKNSFITSGGAVGADEISLANTDDSLEGFDDGTLSWSPSGDTQLVASNDILDETDAFTIRYLAGQSRPVVASAVDSLTLDDASEFLAGDQAVVFDCKGTDVFKVSGLAGNTITGTLSRQYDVESNNPLDTRNPRVGSLVAVRYFVGDGANGPSLFRETLRSGQVSDLEELIEGVESMHIVYGVDPDGDKVPDSYVPAGDTALNSTDEWGSVIAVKIAMLVRTLDEYGQDLDTNDYQLNDFTFETPAAGDRFKRRIFNTTVLLRNRLLQEE